MRGGRLALLAQACPSRENRSRTVDAYLEVLMEEQRQMRRIRIIVLGLSVGLASAAPIDLWSQSANQPAVAARVFDPPRLPADMRLTERAHLDRPAVFRPNFLDRSAWEARREELRRQVLVALGLWPWPARPPIEAVVHGKIDRGDYTVEKVIVVSLAGHYVTGNLYRPKGGSGRRAGVLMPHGHFANGRFHRATDEEVKRDLAGKAEDTEASARYPLQARCVALTRLGCVVFHYDMIGYADATALDHRRGFADPSAELRLQSLLGLQTWNSVRALDFLCSLPDVDATRIGVTGASGGGTQTFLLCAIDDRPAVAAPAVMVSMNMQGGCICENACHLRVGTNNVEIAALFAPKPLFLTAADDWTRDIEQRGLPELKHIYGLYNAEASVAAKYLPFPHNFNQRSMELIGQWFNQHLHLGQPEPIQERPFEPIPPAELSVWRGAPDLPKPKSAAEIRAWLSERDDAILAELAAHPADYVPVLRQALRVLVHSDYPERGTTQAMQIGFEKRDGYGLWRGTQRRRSSGEEMPLIALVPPGSRRAVVWLHSEGKASVFGTDGQPLPAARRLLQAGCTIVAPDLFLTGEYQGAAVAWPPQPHHRDIPFLGFRYGYSRTVLAEQVHDALTTVGHLWTRRDVDQIDLLAFGGAGACGLLTKALAGSALQRTVIDLENWDFDQVTDLEDRRLLPGAMKYGGVHGFVPLAAAPAGMTRLYRLPPSRLTALEPLARRAPGLSIATRTPTLADLVDDLLK